MKVQWPAGLVAGEVEHVRKGAKPIRRPALEGMSSWPVFGHSRILSRKGSKTLGLTRIQGTPLSPSTPCLAGNLSVSQPASSGRLADWFKHSTDDQPLFHGLRVRMGIATGVVPDTSTKSSQLYELAKGVCDAGNGGQILMDVVTFQKIKERVHELGAWDANGLNYRRLSLRKSVMDTLCCRHVPDGREALVLDMGEYEHATVRNGTQQRSSAGVKPLCPRSSSAPCATWRSPATAAFNLGSSLERANWTGPATPDNNTTTSVRLIQIIAPALLGRARVFGNRLSLNEDWVCVDKPYFDAPGSYEAMAIFCDSYQSFSNSSFKSRQGSSEDMGVRDLGTACKLSSLHTPTPIPNITMVFTSVEGVKGFRRRTHQRMWGIHVPLSSLMKAALKYTPGGYWCRQQEGDLQYMVVFSTPYAALEWCLLVQEASMYVQWPAALLSQKPFAAEYDAAGDLVFRGPRLKMGVCEGQPNSILPDHLGRADYHGACINQAARYMDAAAHGGQVVCELDLQQRVFAKWLADSSHQIAATAALELLASQYAVGGTGVSHDTDVQPSTPVGTDAGMALWPTDSEQAAREGSPAIGEGNNLPTQHPAAEPANSVCLGDVEENQPVAEAPAVAEWWQCDCYRMHDMDKAGKAHQLSPSSSSTPAAEGLQSVHEAVSYRRGAVPVTQVDAYRSYSLQVGQQPNTRSHPKLLFPHATTGTVNSAAPSATHTNGWPQAAAASAPHLVVGVNNSSDSSAVSASGSEWQPGHRQTAGGGQHSDQAARVNTSRTEGVVQAHPAHVSPFAQLATPPTAPAVVMAYSLGSFRFKGNPNALDMVHVTVKQLSGRVFPADPPKGKGQRLEAKSGLVDTCEVSLPAFAADLRHRQLRTAPASCPDQQQQQLQHEAHEV
eukprot:jgi/Chrzof1/525/Cz01g19010.t1